MDSHRSLVAWQVARALCVTVLKGTDAHYHPRARALFDQLKRAAISVVANIVEGYAYRNVRQFRRHLSIALGSAAEVECLLDLAAEVHYFPEEFCAEIKKDADRLLSLMFGLMRKLETTQT
jgi:four helix bundle protein